MDDVLDLERRVEDLTAEVERLRGFCSRLRAEVQEHSRRADEAESRETELYRELERLRNG